MLLLDAIPIMLSTNRVLLHDRRTLLHDRRKVALINFERQLVRLREMVRRDLDLDTNVAETVGCLQCYLKLGLEWVQYR